MSDRAIRLSVAREMLEMSERLANDLRIAWSRPLLEVERRLDEQGAVVQVDLSAEPLMRALALMEGRTYALECAVRALVVRRVESLRTHRAPSGDPLREADANVRAAAAGLVSAALRSARDRDDGGTDGSS